jgi:hypothetical protein
MKIRRIKFKRFRNEEWFSFFTEFKIFVEDTIIIIMGNNQTAKY